MGAKILLADDSITIQKVVGIIFAGDEYELSIVDNGASALAQARSSRPDVLLLDAVMPGMTGFEVCEEIRNDPSLQGIPILLLTGAFEPFDEARARECGVDDYIAKPFESQSLVEKVTTLITLGKSRQASSPQPSRPAQAPPPQATAPSQAVSPEPAASPAVSAEEFFFSESSPSPSIVAQPAAGTMPAADEYVVEMVEGTPDDDLWGAFDLEEPAPEPAVVDAFVAAEDEAFTAEVVEEDDPFAFVEEIEPEPLVTVAEEDPFAFVEEVSVSEPASSTRLDEDPFAFAEEEVLPESSLRQPETLPEEPFTFGEETLPAGEEIFEVVPEEEFSADVEDELLLEEDPFEIVSEKEEPAGIGSPVGIGASATAFPEELLAPADPFAEQASLQPSPAPVAPPRTGELGLTEEQITMLVSRISTEILERIAWEVVPDLAERIIREEIKKIKDAAI